MSSTHEPQSRWSISELVDRLSGGDTAALARAISLLEGGGDPASRILAAVSSHRPTLVVGLTGPPGCGKSTLINACIRELRRSDRTVAVVAVDPSSPLTGGSVLGDRTRMGEHSSDEKVFIRSIASRGHLGGLTANMHQILHLISASGRDVILLETVGTGQSETEVAEFSDVNVVVCAPGFGDDLQTIKAGVLEIADILVVNKADLPDADRAARQLSDMLELRNSDAGKVPVITTSATLHEGIDRLVASVDEIASALTDKDRADLRRRRVGALMARLAGERAQCLVDALDGEFTESVWDEVMSGASCVERAVDRILTEVVLRGEDSGYPIE